MKTILVSLALLASINPVYSKLFGTPQSSLNRLNESNLISIAKHQQAHQKIVHKFGSNLAVGSTLAPITTSGTFQTPTVLTSLEILSSSVNDTAAGSGLRTVTVEGLGIDWLEVSETVTMNGTTAVALTTQFYRVNRLFGATSGTYASSAAPSHSSNVTLRTAGAGVTWGIITMEAGFGLGQSEIGVYTCPAGKKAYILSYIADIDASKPVTLIFYRRDNADTVVAPFSPMRVMNIGRELGGEHSHATRAPVNGITCPADIGFMGSIGTGTATISVDFELLLEDI